MSNYDSEHFTSPAPVALVSWRRTDDPSQVIEEIPMLLDTGADVTLVPQRVIEKLKLSVSGDETPYSIAGYDGEVRVYPAASLDLILGNRAFRGKFLVADQDIGVLGRNVLNRMRILFDGPRRLWELRTPQRPSSVS